jgi:Mediator of RNA polymerase II transcription subunit 1
MTGQKTLAYKSPAVKTPASLPGHAQNPSMSSHPSSTPMATAAIRDELLNLDSPAAALINSIASAQDGLGISTPLHGLPPTPAEPARSPEAERLHRLQQVVDTLATKMVGRGVSRDGVERIARVHGFEALWDEDILTIAGNIVELEIHFSPLSKDKVSDLVLKLNTADGESHTQNKATAVLKGQVDFDEDNMAAEDLRNFSTNIKYLAQMDRISTTPNAFEVTGSLHKAFRSIWEEEKKRMKWRSDIHHLCTGSLGRPNMDENPRLGLVLDYWKGRHEDEGNQVRESSTTSLLKASISCETGSSSIPTSLEWLSSKILQEYQAENGPTTGESLQQPAWNESSTNVVVEALADAMAVDNGTPKSLNLHFICELDPPILLPLNTALRLNAEYRSLDIDQSQAVTCSQALQNARNLVLPSTAPNTIELRWTRSLPSRNDSTIEHSYALYSSAVGSELWLYPVSRLKFSHPRDLAGMIPILRQYAVLWSLLSNLVIGPKPSAPPQSPTSPPSKRRIMKKSNKKPESLLETIPGPSNSNVLNIDISLDIVSDPTTSKLEVFAPLRQTLPPSRTTTTASPGKKVSHSSCRSSFIHFSILVKLNGLIEVSELSGVTSEKEAANLMGKVARMISVTEDIGLVLEWLVERENGDKKS